MTTHTHTVDTLLFAMGVRMPAEFLARPDMQQYLCQLDHILELAAGERQRLGELLRAAQRITSAQLQDALAEQRCAYRKLGDILIEKQLLTQQERDAILEFQRRQSGIAPPSGKFILGTILLANGEITRVQLEDALHRQAHSGRRLGVELVSAGHASRTQIDANLSLQRRIIAYALAVSAGLAPLVPAALAAKPVAAMAVAAVAVATVQLPTERVPTQLKLQPVNSARRDAAAAPAPVMCLTAQPVRAISGHFPWLVGFLHRIRWVG